MPFFKFDDLRSWTGGTWEMPEGSTRKVDIRGFSTDSRNIEKDFAFIALKGERDGHDFAQSAIENGASAVIAERKLDLPVPVLVVPDTLKAFQTIGKFHRLRFENPVVAISGSCGKTSTKEMLAKLLSWKNPLVTEKNFNNEIGVPITLTKIDMRQNQCAIVEAGVGAPSQMQELAEMISPDVAIITNVGLAHMERFGEISNVAKEKAVLPANVCEGGWCIMHSNLLSWKSFEELKCKKAIVAKAESPEIKADLVFRYSFVERGESVGLDMFIEGGNEYFFELGKMTQGMLENAVLAIACALMLGAKEEQIAMVTPTFAPLPMRGLGIEINGNMYYADCYNASPTSMKDALAHFVKISDSTKPRLFVLGTMAELGLSAHRHHKEIGYNLPRNQGDKAILVGVNAETYKSGMLEGGWEESDINIYANSSEAKAEIEAFAGSVFIKGSRVCELEKSLPTELFELLTTGKLPTPEVSSTEENIDDSAELESSEESTDISDDTLIPPSDIEDEFEEYDDDETDDDDFSDEDFSEDDEVLETEDDNEDERETI